MISFIIFINNFVVTSHLSFSQVDKDLIFNTVKKYLFPILNHFKNFFYKAMKENQNPEKLATLACNLAFNQEFVFNLLYTILKATAPFEFVFTFIGT